MPDNKSVPSEEEVMRSEVRCANCGGTEWTDSGKVTFIPRHGTQFGGKWVHGLCVKNDIEHQRSFIEEINRKPDICPECEGEMVIMTAPPGAGHADDLSEYCPCSTCKGTGLFPPPEKVRDWEVALAEYSKLQQEIGRLEETGECACNANEFHRCGLCVKTSAIASRARSLMTRWGDTWAMQLFATVTRGVPNR